MEAQDLHKLYSDEILLQSDGIDDEMEATVVCREVVTVLIFSMEYLFFLIW